MTPRALALAQKLEWFNGKEIQDVDLKEIEQELEAVRREAIQEAIDMVGVWLRAYPTDIFPEPPAGKHGVEVDICSASMGRFVAKGIINQLTALNGPGTKGSI